MRLDAHFGMLPERAFQRFGGRMTYEGKSGSSPPPPDYTPLGAASEKSAELGYKLGKEQLDEARRQYDITREVAEPVVQRELGLMDEALRQGKDYYEYGRRGRGVEEALRAQSLQDTTARDTAERDLITGGDTDIYNARRPDIESQVDRATADARQGLTSQYNTLLRQALRYGYNPQAVAARFGPAAVQGGLGIASAANAARQGGISNARGLLAQGRGMRIQDEAIPWARKLDVSGLYRGTPGASQGAYSLALNAGNAATANTAAPGNALLSGMAQGAGVTQMGMGQQLAGLGNIANAQAGLYGQGLQLQAANNAATGNAIGSLAGMAATAFII